MSNSYDQIFKKKVYELKLCINPFCEKLHFKDVIIGVAHQFA